MSVHEGVKIKYPCNQCDSEFVCKKALKNHRLSIHEGIRYPCSQCKSKLTTYASLQRHKMTVHEGI